MNESTEKKYKMVADAYLAMGMNGVKAYQSVYPDASDSTASVEMNRILKIPKIADYVAERQSEVSESHGITFDSQLEDLERAKEVALNNKQIGAYARCIELQNKMLGLHERHNEQKHPTIIINEVTSHADETSPSNPNLEADDSITIPSGFED